MAINSLETAVKYSGELDKFFTQKSVMGMFEDNVFGAKFVGNDGVIIPDVEFVGLIDYDRDGGFAQSAMTVNQEVYKLEMDRGRSVSIDSMDMDETGIAGLAGKIMGEFVRTKAVPECDAYCLSKIAGLVSEEERKTTGTATPFKTFIELTDKVHEAVGHGEELVCFVNTAMYSALRNTTEFQKQVIVSDFKKGEISTTVKSIDGIAIIPVDSKRMKTAYDFVKTVDAADTERYKKGGFEVAEGAKDICMLVLPKNGASLVKKTEKMRIFTPEQNLAADAYKFDYRIHYDIFVKKSLKGAIGLCTTA